MGKWHSADYFDFERIRESLRFSRIRPGDRVGTGVGADFPSESRVFLLHFLGLGRVEPKISSNQSVFCKLKDVVPEVFCVGRWQDLASSKSFLVGRKSPRDWGLSWGMRFPRFAAAR